MKNSTYFILISIFCSTGAIAQTACMAGRITGGDGGPLPFAKVTVTANGQDIQAIADKDGLYFAPDLQAGSYNVAIAYSGNSQAVTNVAVPASGRPAHYYNFTVASNAATLHMDDKSPFMATALERAKHDPVIFDTEQRTLPFKLNAATGKMEPIIGEAEKEPVTDGNVSKHRR